MKKKIFVVIVKFVFIITGPCSIFVGIGGCCPCSGGSNRRLIGGWSGGMETTTNAPVEVHGIDVRVKKKVFRLIIGFILNNFYIWISIFDIVAFLVKI